MEKKQSVKPAAVICLKMVPRYFGCAKAARILGVSGTQVKRHISGHTPSMSLARRMAECGVVFEK